MSVTIEELIKFARTHVKLVPIIGIGGFTNEPSLTIANKVKSRIINQSYNWEWNRASIPTFLTEDGKDEYVIRADDVGWLERTRIEKESDTTVPKTIHYLKVKRDLQKGWFKATPSEIALDITSKNERKLRFSQIPDNTIWRVYVDYQRKFCKMTALTDCFDPIPSEMDDIITQFFLAFIYKLVDNNQHYRELVEAERLLMNFRGFSDVEESSVGFVPEYGLLMG